MKYIKMKDETGLPISFSFIFHLLYFIFALIGASPSGKAPPFGGGIRRFESSRPSFLGKDEV
jgi:hypothetical protein